MGGLKKDLPITYWTFLIGALAIAGVPPLAGFFTKDEILCKTFAGGHTDPVGRSGCDGAPDRDLHVPPGVPDVPRRAPSRCAAAAHGTAHARTADMRPCRDHGAWPRSGHGGHLHDAPPAMALALIVLAIGSVARRLRRRAARARRRQPHRGVPRAGVRGARRGARRPSSRSASRPAGEAAAPAGARTGGEAARRSQTELTADGALDRRRARRHRPRARTSGCVNRARRRAHRAQRRRRSTRCC